MKSQFVMLLQCQAVFELDILVTFVTLNYNIYCIGTARFRVMKQYFLLTLDVG